MTFKIFYLFLLIIFSSSNLFAEKTDNVKKIVFNNTTYIETFYDDFDGIELDSTKWERVPEWKRGSLGAGAYWKNECSFLEDGMLVIEGKKEKDLFLSGGIRSKGRFTQSFGLYKIRFKVDYSSAIVYSFWLTNTSQGNIGNGATDGAEMDIFEILCNKYNSQNKREQFLNSAIHWDGYGKELKSKGSQYFIDDSFFNTWHEVTFEWTPHYYKAYLDDSTTPYWDTEGKEKKYGGINTAENFLKITSEITTWGGPLIEELFPAHFYVDWVKVYKPIEVH